MDSQDSQTCDQQFSDLPDYLRDSLGLEILNWRQLGSTSLRQCSSAGTHAFYYLLVSQEAGFQTLIQAYHLTH